MWKFKLNYYVKQTSFLGNYEYDIIFLSYILKDKQIKNLNKE